MPAGAGLPARSVASRLLHVVLEKQDPLDRALDEAADFKALEPDDRAFARAMVSITLRRLGSIDEALAGFLDRPLKGHAMSAHNLLRLGAAQILFMQTPAHAAVSTMTELAGAHKRTRAFKGLVNAVLRRLSEAPPDMDAPDMLRANTPGWMRRSWERAYGPPAAKAIAPRSGAPPQWLSSSANPIQGPLLTFSMTYPIAKTAR